jgi:hypothetical protein
MAFSSKTWNKIMSDPIIWNCLVKFNHYTQHNRNVEESKRFCFKKYNFSINEREHIFIHVGGAGIRLGDRIWKDIQINDAGGELGSMFYRNFDQTFKARGIFVDTDKSSFESLTSPMYDRNLFVSGSVEVSMRETVENVLRKLMEESFSTKGIFITHSLGGVTGSSKRTNNYSNM